MDIRYSAHPKDVKRYTTQELRDEFLIENLYKPDQVVAVYSHVDRMVTLGCMPVNESVSIDKGIDVWANFGTQYFLERREIGMFNIGGAGRITVDGRACQVGFKEAMYIGMGSKEIVFASDDAQNPAKFYLNSAPAHRTCPTVLIKPEGEPEEGVVIVKDENKVELGSLEDANHRVICKYILPGQVESCQLEMGMSGNFLIPNR